MEIRGFMIHDSELQETRPFVRMSNVGCGLAGCACSGERFISISNGKEGLMVQLTEMEWQELNLPSEDVFGELLIGEEGRPIGEGIITYTCKKCGAKIEALAVPRLLLQSELCVDCYLERRR